MWRRVVDEMSEQFRVVLFDHVGAGDSDWSAYDAVRYGSLEGYAADVLEICEELSNDPITYVGHSVGATIGVLAANLRPDLIRSLVLVCPSPRFSNTDGYTGGFSSADIAELLDLMDKNHLDWSALMAPTVMGVDAVAEQEEWRGSVCRVDPATAKQFARLTFEADNRADYAALAAPTLIIDCSDDALAPSAVGDHLHRAISGSERLTLQATGHCPHLTRPSDVTAAILAFDAGRTLVRTAA
ncbi:alpha/beta hydrolase [Brevundimonas sp. PAMC22021]|nr:alpha/beta hydrolase [Brevundimonas sp. PAMC22021]QYF87053.1 alpha/beta hydrolase [Brevundimonas sp. PAMC22021]